MGCPGQRSHHSLAPRLLRRVSDYFMPNVSEKVFRMILSSTHYVNRKVWQKG